MNSRQLQYAIELSKVRNFSQVSEKLNISQPALSKQIINLENELGVKLFDRNNVPVSLTAAGDYFLRQAQVLLQQEDQLIRSLDQFKTGQRGRLTIGISPFRNLYMMPQILKKFKKKYPLVQVILYETNSDQLRSDVAEGKYDFAIVNLPVDESVLNIELLETERMVLAVPNALVDKIHGPVDMADRRINFVQCRDLPFVVLAQSQELRRYFDNMCASCDFVPNISVEVAGGVTTAWSIARAGLGATLLPLQFLGENGFDELTLFTLTNSSYTRQPTVVTRRGQYISEFAQYAIDLLRDYVSQ